MKGSETVERITARLEEKRAELTSGSRVEASGGKEGWGKGGAGGGCTCLCSAPCRTLESHLGPLPVSSVGRATWTTFPAAARRLMSAARLSEGRRPARTEHKGARVTPAERQELREGGREGRGVSLAH